jgi:hypothetical protein
MSGPTPIITNFNPISGWSGTIVEIYGYNFDANRDRNVVQVGGHRALILEAATDRLRVVTDENTITGPIEVIVAGKTGASSDEFNVLSHPDQDDISQHGPPIKYTGPQSGTPSPKAKNQKILSILVYPKDYDPGTPVQRTIKRNDQISLFKHVNRFYEEASYEQCSFDFKVTDWLKLDHDFGFYFWNNDDVIKARSSLYHVTRLGIAASGTLAYLAHREAGLAIIDVSNPLSLSMKGKFSFFSHEATAVRVAGSRAYVGVGMDGIHVLDVTSPAAPSELARVPISGWVADLDLLSTYVYVAASEQGLRVVNTVTSTEIAHIILPNPRRTSSPGWAMGVRVSGTHAYIAAGQGGLVIVDIRNPSTPKIVGRLEFESWWAVAVDVNGTTAYIATDGAGTKIVDVSNPAAPTLQSTERTVLRPRGLSVNVNRLYVAAADKGLRIVDVSNPKSPAELGHLDLNPAFNVMVSGNTAYVALGQGKITLVNVSNAAKPVAQGSYNAAPFRSTQLDFWREKLDTASNGQGLIKKSDAFLTDSFKAAQVAGFNLEEYEGFIFIQHGPGLRGQSWTDTGVPPYNDTHITFSGTKGLIYLASDALWGRRAHEMGHWFGLGDIYEEYYADGTYILGSGAPWDMMGNHDGNLSPADGYGPIFSGFHMADKLYYYDRYHHPDAPLPDVASREWTMDAAPVDEPFEIMAHDRTRDIAPKVHLLSLKVAEGLYYFVEVRQRPGGPSPVIFDKSIPVPTDAAHPWHGGVIVTKVLVNNNHANMRERYITLLEKRVLQVTDEIVDAARRLRIIVEARTNDRPLTYRVRLQWNQPVKDAGPAGKFDLHITPWTNDNWASIDIWVNSPRNDPGSTPLYEFHQKSPDDPTIPQLTGDRPWVNHENFIFARIRNSGVVEAHNVSVSFYTNSPPGIGDNGSWVLRENKQIDIISPKPPGNEVIRQALWMPDKGEHTCLKVEIAAQIGEVTVANNLAQENVFVFDSPSSSSHVPVEFDTVVRNPYPQWKLVYLQVHGLPDGWFAVIDHSWVWVGPRGEKALKVIIWTVKDTPEAGNRPFILDQAHVRIEGWTTQMHRLLPIGGLMAIVKANHKVNIDLDIVQTSVGMPLIVNGCLKPPLANVPITVEVTDPEGKKDLLHVRSDNQGCFQTDRVLDREAHIVHLNGKYQVQVFVSGDGSAAETESDVMSFESVSPNSQHLTGD